MADGTAKHLHKEFLLDRERFDAAADYWRRLCDEVLRESGQTGSWKPFFGIHVDTSQIVVEEGSIYSLHSETQHKAINIEQYLPKSKGIEIAAMVDTFGEDMLAKPIEVLTMWCALSEESAAIGRQLLAAWIHLGTTRLQMEDSIMRVIPRAKNPFEEGI